MKLNLNRIFIFVIALLLSFNSIVFSQTFESESNDSTKNTKVVAGSPAGDTISAGVLKSKILPELVVESQNAVAIKDGFAFTPTKKEKSMSVDAASLLRRMALPTLIISTDGIKSVNGSEISYFIDSKPASADDCKSLLPEDVLRVEYLSYPSDPQFTGAKAVINFVMKRYEYGGYTRLMPSQSFMVNKGSYPVYSKINYKRMTFDVNATAGYYNYSDVGNTTHTVYQGLEIPELNADEDLYSFSKISGRSKSEEYGASFRAQYDDNSKFYSFQLVNFSWMREPTSILNGFTEYLPEVFNSTNTSVGNSLKNQSYTYTGYYRYRPNRANLFSLITLFKYLNSQNSYSYSLGDVLPFSNANRDNIYTPYFKLFYQHNFGSSDMMVVELQSNTDVYFTDFMGDVKGGYSQRTYYNTEKFIARYQHSFGKSLSFYVYAGLDFNLIRLNGVTRQNSWTPMGGMTLNGRFSPKSLFNVTFFAQTNTPDFAYVNNVGRRVNEVEWVVGNPNLSVNKQIVGMISYTQIFSNSFSGNINFAASKNYDWTLPSWTPVGEYMLKKYYSNADKNIFLVQIGFPIKLFNGSLVINPKGEFNHRRYSGKTKQIMNSLSGSVDISYSVGPMEFSAYYFTRGRGLVDEYKYYEAMQYGFNVLFKKGDFFALIDLYCPFSNRKALRYSIDYPN